LNAARAVVTGVADEHGLPVENLLQPDALRRLAWAPPTPLEESSVRAALAERGARAWQLDLVAAPLVQAMAEAKVEAIVDSEPAGS
jgi:ribonuclease D